MSNNRVLIIAYQFPPLGGVGPQRALSLCRYLPDYGFEVHVLTPRNGVSHTYDRSLLTRIPECVRVHRTFTPELPYALRTKAWALLSRKNGSSGGAPGPQGGPRIAHLPGELVHRVFFPDPQRVWALTAVRAGVEIVRQHDIGTVLVTAPPFSSLLVGTALKRRCPGVRLVSDFRDEWLDFYMNEVYKGPAAAAQQRAESTQRRIVTESDAVVAVTPSSLDRIRMHASDQPAEKFVYIPNGYDPEVMPAAAPATRTCRDRIVVTHLGTVYGPNSPEAYLDALDRMPEAIRSRFVTRFIGRVAPEMAKIFEGRRSDVEVNGFMPQAEALRWLADSDYLLAAMLNGQTVVAKTYEYLAAGKPILAITPRDGEVARVLAETRAGWCAGHDEPECMASMIRNAYQAWAERRPFEPDMAAIERYDRRKAAGKFAELIRFRG